MDSMETDSENIQKRLYFVNEHLREFHSKLDYEIQTRIPLELLVQMANVLVADPVIFDVVRELRECQNTAEKLLKKQRDEQTLLHQKEIENYTRTLNDTELGHTVQLCKIQYDKKLKEMDKNIVNELDVTVKEQQQTLQALKVPGFFESDDPKDILVQMHLLSFLLRLQKLLSEGTK